MATVTDAGGVWGEAGAGDILQIVHVDHEGFDGPAVDPVAVIEHPALLVGVTVVFEAGDFGTLGRPIPAQEGEELVFVIEIDRGQAVELATLLQNLKVVLFLLNSPADIAGAEDQPGKAIVRAELLPEFFNPGESGVDKVAPVSIVRVGL